jgi:hypothetical protein
MVLIIMGFRLINSQSVINAIFTIAGYTYGPLLGLYAFGLLTKHKINDSPKILILAIICPLLVWGITSFSQRFLNGYQFSYEHLLLNGIFIFLGLSLLRKKETLSGGTTEI